MCRTVQSILQTIICGVQMMIRLFMTVLLMVENLIRMILQTIYNLISFFLQLISMLPLCLVFFITSKLRSIFCCGGGGGANRGGIADCLMSILALVILFFILKHTGVMDKIFCHFGYAKSDKLRDHNMEFLSMPTDVTEFSSNDSTFDVHDYVASTVEVHTLYEPSAFGRLVTDYVNMISSKEANDSMDNFILERSVRGTESYPGNITTDVEVTYVITTW